MQATLAVPRINSRYKNSDRICSRGIKERCIIKSLAQNPGQTRNSVAKDMARELGLPISNSYGYVFKELEGCLIPNGIVQESGYKKTRMGPRVLQESGIPSFRLSDAGMIVAASLDELGLEKRIEMVERCLASRAIANPGEFPFYEYVLAQFRSDPKVKLQLIKTGVSEFIEGRVAHPIIPLLEEGREQRLAG
ncbi:MAG TPA: hypothetical protein VHA09_07565 [Nitrososphaera sp.]|nr:hypothetical protein [Nitrososphaera sp.]